MKDQDNLTNQTECSVIFLILMSFIISLDSQNKADYLILARALVPHVRFLKFILQIHRHTILKELLKAKY